MKKQQKKPKIKHNERPKFRRPKDRRKRPRQQQEQQN